MLRILINFWVGTIASFNSFFNQSIQWLLLNFDYTQYINIKGSKTNQPLIEKRVLLKTDSNFLPDFTTMIQLIKNQSDISVCVLF